MGQWFARMQQDGVPLTEKDFSRSTQPTRRGKVVVHPKSTILPPYPCFRVLVPYEHIATVFLLSNWEQRGLLRPWLSDPRTQEAIQRVLPDTVLLDALFESRLPVLLVRVKAINPLLTHIKLEGEPWLTQDGISLASPKHMYLPVRQQVQE